jgi:hypothetical protein
MPTLCLTLASASDVSRRLRSASVTLSTASQGLLSSIMNYSDSDKATATGGPSPSSSPAEIASISASSKPHSPSLPPPMVYHCSRCHGTVEGPKYSTCTCAVPAVETATDPHPHSSASSAHSSSHHTGGVFWKGLSYDPKTMFNAAVNMFQKRKSEPAASPLPPLEHPQPQEQGQGHEQTEPQGQRQGQGREVGERVPLRVDSDDEVDDEEEEKRTAAGETLSTTVSSVFPMVSLSQGTEQEKEESVVEEPEAMQQKPEEGVQLQEGEEDQQEQGQEPGDSSLPL